jgi:D-aspartate ligase
MCLGQPVLEFYDPSSIGNYAAILSRSDHVLYEKMRAFLEELGYVGFSNFDMKYDSRSGRYVLFEINPRLGRSSFFAYAAGMNFIEYLCEDAVYGRRKDCVFNENTALWSHVPTGVLRKYVKDPALRAELQRYPVNYTLWWKDDRNLKRAYRIFRFQHAQFKSFRRYYFDKSGDWMNQH